MIKHTQGVPQLISKSFVYTELDSGDLFELVELFSDPRVSIPMGIRPVKSREDAERTVAAKKSANAFHWVIRLRETQEFVGIFGLHNIHWQHRCAQIGGGLLPSKWRNGYGLEIVKRLSDFAFRELSLHRIEGHLYPDNIPMRNLFIKAGFQIEGLLRQNFFYEGKTGDTLIMGLIQDSTLSP